MKLLLDTHVAIWAVSARQRLPERIINLIADPANSVLVGMVTLWEIAIKNNLGRATRDPIGLTVDQAHQAFVEAEFAILPIKSGHLSVVERLPRFHGDPFDSLIVATAENETLRLVTHDDALAAYGNHVIVV